MKLTSFFGVSVGQPEDDDEPDETPEELFEEKEHLEDPEDTELRLRTEAVLEEMEALEREESLEVVRMLQHVLLCSSRSASAQHSSSMLIECHGSNNPLVMCLLSTKAYRLRSSLGQEF